MLLVRAARIAITLARAARLRAAQRAAPLCCASCAYVRAWRRTHACVSSAAGRHRRRARASRRVAICKAAAGGKNGGGWQKWAGGEKRHGASSRRAASKTAAPRRRVANISGKAYCVTAARVPRAASRSAAPPRAAVPLPVRSCVRHACARRCVPYSRAATTYNVRATRRSRRSFNVCYDAPRAGAHCNAS